MRKTKEVKRIENATEAAFRKHGCNIQFNIMDIGKILKAGEIAGMAGNDIELAVVEAILLPVKERCSKSFGKDSVLLIKSKITIYGDGNRPVQVNDKK